MKFNCELHVRNKNLQAKTEDNTQIYYTPRRENKRHNKIRKFEFSIAIDNRSMNITVLPSSFNWKLKMLYATNSTLGYANEMWRSGKELHLCRVLFIGLSKR
jgi:hypothetical protein